MKNGTHCLSNAEHLEELTLSVRVALTFLHFLEHGISLKHSDNQLFGLFHTFYIVNKVVKHQSINDHY